MTATESRLPCHLMRKFGCELRPPPVLRRDERIRSVASSFEEITESEEEEVQEEALTRSVSLAGRSPFCGPDSPFTQRRSNSLTHNPLVSPKFGKRVIPPRLTRGFSDPSMRRKSSLNSLFNGSPCQDDLLALPPIPEAGAPASPVSTPNNVFKDDVIKHNNNNNNDDVFAEEDEEVEQ